jgi:cytoskeletal protein CcmA (bactofilin family)
LWKQEQKIPELESQIIGFLGEGTDFKGVLTFEGTVRIDGRFEGEVFTRDSLIVGEEGQVKAQVEVGQFICKGRFQGDILARRLVKLYPPAEVTGTMRAPAIVIVDGAVFNGKCEMYRPEAPPANSLSPVAEPAVKTAAAAGKEK